MTPVDCGLRRDAFQLCVAPLSSSVLLDGKRENDTTNRIATSMQAADEQQSAQ